MIQIQYNSLVQRAKDIPFSKLDDELLAIDPQGGYCYSLNESAGRIWELIGTESSVQAVCTQLGREYAVDAATCLREVTSLLQDLHSAGLVKVNDAGTAAA